MVLLTDTTPVGVKDQQETQVVGMATVPPLLVVLVIETGIELNRPVEMSVV